MAQKWGAVDEEQILGILKQVVGGRTIADVCREHGISDACA